MTDTLIPYSFTPGTKAKAQEVNANFIALADSITTTNSNKLNKDLSNISQTGINVIKNNSALPRNIGEVIVSTIPLTDAGLHLLDGSLLQYGSYKAFIDYIADLYDSGDYTDIFETEANWQTAVSTYGVCGKFVYNSTNNTVRLPKYNSKIYTGGGTASVIGNGKALGITNGSTEYGLSSTSISGVSIFTGKTDTINTNIGTSTSGSNPVTDKSYGITTNATKSGIIANLANITTSLDGYYYIVIATAIKTDIQVDIDEIATDLSGKTDVDLINLNNTGKIAIAHNAMPSDTYSNLTLGASNSTYTAPADGYYIFRKMTTAAGQYINLENSTNKISSFAQCYSSALLNVFLPVKKGDVITCTYNAAGTTNAFRFIYAVGSISSAN